MAAAWASASARGVVWNTLLSRSNAASVLTNTDGPSALADGGGTSGLQPIGMPRPGGSDSFSITGGTASVGCSTTVASPRSTRTTPGPVVTRPTCRTVLSRLSVVAHDRNVAHE